MANKKITLDDPTLLSDMLDHFIEIPQPDSSADTLQFNDVWPRNFTIFHVTNKDSNSTIGQDKVEAEIDGFKLANDGNLVLDCYPHPNKQIKPRAMPIAYLTSNLQVPDLDANGQKQMVTLQDGVTKKPKMKSVEGVVYRGVNNYKDPYEPRARWQRHALGDTSERSKGIALIQGLVSYIRSSADVVNYDYNTPDMEEIVDNIVDEKDNDMHIDDATKVLQMGEMNQYDNTIGGATTNNDETGADENLDEESNGFGNSIYGDPNAGSDTKNKHVNGAQTELGAIPNFKRKPASSSASSNKKSTSTKSGSSAKSSSARRTTTKSSTSNKSTSTAKKSK